MHLKPLLLLGLGSVVSAAEAPTTGVIVSADLPDGFYMVPLDGATLVTNASAFEPVDLSALARRHPAPASALARNGRRGGKALARRYYDLQGTGKTFADWIHNDCNTCTNAWREFFLAGNKVPGHFMCLCTSGDAVLAGCNYINFHAGNMNTNPTMVDYFNGKADNSVGWCKMAWMHFEHWYMDDFTFWRDIRGTPMCTNLPS